MNSVATWGCTCCTITLPTSTLATAPCSSSSNVSRTWTRLRNVFKLHNNQYLHLLHLFKLLEGVHFNDIVIQVIDIELGGQPDLVTGVIPDINTLDIICYSHLSCHQSTHHSLCQALSPSAISWSVRRQVSRILCITRCFKSLPMKTSSWHLSP